MKLLVNVVFPTALTLVGLYGMYLGFNEIISVGQVSFGTYLLMIFPTTVFFMYKHSFQIHLNEKYFEKK